MVPEFQRSTEELNAIAQYLDGNAGPRSRRRDPRDTCGGCGRMLNQCSCLQDRLLSQIRACGLPDPVAEFRAIDGRRLRWDFAWPDRMLLLEIQGGSRLGGDGWHTDHKGFSRDCEKRSLAAIAGYRVIECTGEQVHSGLAVGWIRNALEM